MKKIITAAILFFTTTNILFAQTSFTSGNLVVYRVGSGSGALSSTAAQVFIDEYTPAGALVQSIAMPTVASGGNNPLVSSGSATSEGLLSLSADGHYLLLTGYSAAPGTTSIAGTTSAAVPRVVGRIDASGTINTTTGLTDFATGNNPRGVASTNGTDLWVTGGAGGVRYATIGSTTSTQLSTTVVNLRGANITNGQLYISTSSGSAVRIGTVGTGTPTTTSQTITTLPGLPVSTGSPYSFFFADLSSSVPGVDVLYIADDTPGAIQKYSLVSGSWVASGTISATGIRGLTGKVNSSSVTLYGATGASIYTLTDNSGYNTTISGSVTTLTTAATNTAFRGIAFAPCISPVIGSVTGNGSTICSNQNLVLGISATGSAALTYTWSGPGGSFSSTSVASPTVTNAVTGNYSITVANACGTATSVASVTVNTIPTITANTTSTVVCIGQQITLTAGGTATSYTWSNGVNDGVAFAPSATQAYTLTGSNANGCTNTATVNVAVNTLPTVSFTGKTTLCVWQIDTLTAHGATSYTWSPFNNFTAQTIGGPSSPGNITFTLTGMDANGCTNSISQLITVNTPPTISASSTSSVVCSGNQTTLSGSGASTYAWSNGVSNGVAFTPTATTTYTVIGTDLNNCSDTTTISVTVNNLPTVVANTASTVVCAGQQITLTGSGASTYTWSSGVTNGTAFTPSSTNTYTVTGTDVNNCTNTNVVSVSVNTLPTVVANASATTICAGDAEILTGSGAQTYTWTGSVIDGNSFNPSASNTYTVTGTDANGCMNSDNISVTVNLLPNVTATASSNTVCAGDNTSLFGHGATTYTWSSSVSNGVSFTPSSSNTYTVTGTSSANCTNTATILVTVNSLPNVQANTTATAVCTGQQITLTGSGASTYTWSSSVTDGSAFTPSSTNSYTVTGTDANNCTNTGVVSVTVNTLPNVQANTTASVVCVGQPTTLTGSGASTYTWSSGVINGSVFTPASTNTYTLTGSNGANCSNTATISITVNSLPNVQANTTATVVCAGQQITLTGSGASSYTWSTGVTNGSAFTPSSTDTYTVIGTDVNNCTNTNVVSVTVNTLPNVQANSTATAVCTGQQITLTGSGALTYTWSAGVTNGSAFTPSSTNTYTVTGTDVNNCTNTNVVSITVSNVPNVQANATATTVCTGQQTTLTGSGATTYTWSSSVIDGSAFTPSSTNTYTVTGSSGANCSNTATISITVNNLPSVVANTSTTSVCAGGQITLTGSGASTYTWSAGVINGTAFTPTNSATYTVTGVDANNCTNVATVSITVNNCTTTGINSVNKTDLNIYPNPTSGEFTVNGLPEGATVQVYNELGMYVTGLKENNGNAPVSIANMNNGIYLLRIFSNDGSFISQHKIIKQQ